LALGLVKKRQKEKLGNKKNKENKQSPLIKKIKPSNKKDKKKKLGNKKSKENKQSLLIKKIKPSNKKDKKKKLGKDKKTPKTTLFLLDTNPKNHYIIINDRKHRHFRQKKPPPRRQQATGNYTLRLTKKVNYTVVFSPIYLFILNPINTAGKGLLKIKHKKRSFK